MSVKSERKKQVYKSKKSNPVQPAIRPIMLESDSEVVIKLIDFNGKKPSPEYHYGTRTGTVTKKEHKCPVGEWIGEIRVSRSMAQRMWVAATNLFNDFQIPTEPEVLEKFIEARGEKGPWFRIQFANEDGVQGAGAVYLPNVLGMAQHVNDKDPEGRAVIATAVVAPKHVGKGFGKALHVLAAAHFKTLGYKTLVSDIVGFNTDSEIAVWKSLQKDFKVESYNMNGFSTTRVLRDLNIIDDGMFDLLNTRVALVINGKAMTLKEISDTEFPQFEMDLTDERVPLLKSFAVNR